ncbi:MAG: YdcF family protein [Coleofasciculaceae cyanobacterium]
MFQTLTQLLLWLLITFILYNVLLKLIPKQYFTLLGGLFLFAVVVLAFFFPSNSLVSAAWEVLSFPLKPVGACIFLLAIAIRKGLGDSKNLVTAALLILLISSTPFVANFLAQRAEIDAINSELRRQEVIQRDSPGGVVSPSAQTAGAIVILGQGTTQANLPYRTQIQLNDTGDRILYAAELYRQQRARGNNPLMIISAGPRVDLQGTPEQTTEANDIAQLLTQLGVPQDRIVRETRGVDLRSSAEEIDRILRARGLGNAKIFLVTSGLNSRRARLTFSKLNLNVVSQPTDFYGFQTGAAPRLRIRVESFIPSVEALGITTQVWKEALGSVYYYLRGWLGSVPL